jgi:ribosomal protein S18 acetylase RimI-like enzyme
MLTNWVAVFTQGYPIPEAWSQVFYKMLAGMGLDQPVRNYLGYLDGRPVATANMFLGAGVSGIYCVATLPEARGRGIGAEMTLVPLRDARQMGYRIGILQSSEMGYRVYERLGFTTVCMMDHYSWKHPDLDSPA